MKKSTEKIRFASFISLLIFLGFGLFYLFIFVRCFFVIDNIPELKNVPIVRIMIYGNSKETVSAKISLLNTKGKEFAVLDRSWSGQSLSIEFTSASFDGKEYLFPLRVYSENYFQSERNSVYKGKKLFSYYVDDGECLFLDSTFSKKQRTSLYALAVFADYQSTKFQSKYSKIYSLNLSALLDGETYEITTSSDGSLNIFRM